jgi:aryl-alcohol dehydrogenase-like predicted oxidoreductase
MNYRKLGNSDLNLTSIIFGAWAIGGWMWGGADKKEGVKAVEKALDLGITTIDTAAVYGFGQSEELVAQAIKGKRDKVQLLTKFGLRWDNTEGEFYFHSQDNEGKPLDIYKLASKESIIKECEDSLRRLNTDYIDLYQMHWPNQANPIEESMEALNQLIKQGKIRYAGVSNFSTEQLEEALKTAPVVSNQVPYSMVKRDIEDKLVPYCKENNIGILAYSPMQRGILTGKMKKGYPFNEGDTRPNMPQYQEPNFSRINDFLDKIKPVADKRGITLAQLVLNWTIQQDGITAALAGSRNPEQISDNARAGEFMLDQEELKTIREHLNDLQLEV